MSVYTGSLHDMVSGYVSSLGVLLVDDSFVQGEQTTVADVVGNELTDAGYARQTPSFTVDVVDQTVTLNVDTVVFGPFTGAVIVGTPIFFLDTGTDSTSTLISADDVVSTDVPAGQSFTYNPSGVLALQITEADDE